MPWKGLGLAPRLRYLAGRARRIDVGSVVVRAKEASQQHGKWTPAIVVDMLWQAGFARSASRTTSTTTSRSWAVPSARRT